MKAGARSVVAKADGSESDPGEIYRADNVPVLLPLTEHSGPSEYVEAHDDDGHGHWDSNLASWHIVLGYRIQMNYSVKLILVLMV